MRCCSFLLAAFLSACVPGIAAATNNTMPPSAAIKNTGRLDGNVVRVHGYVIRGYGNACLYDNKEFAEGPAVSVFDPRALAVLIPDDQMEKFKSADHKMITIVGRLRKDVAPGQIIEDICSTPFVEMQSFQISPVR